MARRVVEFASALLQGRVDGRLERGATGERALCQTVVLDRVPLRLNPVQLGAVRRQVIEGDPDRLELGQGGFDGLAVVDAIVVQRDGAGALPAVVGGQRLQGRPATGHPDELPADEVEQGLAVQLARPRQAGLIDEARPGPKRGEGAQRVHPPAAALRGAPRPAGALPRPGVAGGHRRGEAALIQVEQVVLAPRGRLRQSAKAASSAWACAWRTGSALCCTVRLVRFQRKRRAARRSPRYLGRTRTPCVAASQAASCGPDQVRSPRRAASSSRRSVASRCASVSVGGRPGRGRSGSTAQPAARKALTYLRTVCSCLPKYAAILGTDQPRSESRTISRRSRRAGATTRSRARRCNSVRCSGVRQTRNGFVIAGCPPARKSTIHLTVGA